jgi:hypothetical protein
VDLRVEWASTSPHTNAAELETAGVTWTVVRHLNRSGAAFKSEGALPRVGDAGQGGLRRPLDCLESKCKMSYNVETVEDLYLPHRSY